MSRICIPDHEYKERIARAAKMVADKGLDVMVVCSTESDYANARPLRRAIQSDIEDMVAEKMLMGEIKAGDSVKIDFADGEFIIIK